MDVGYKDSDLFVFPERFNEIVKSSNIDFYMKNRIDQLKYESFQSEDEINKYCDFFISYWFNREVPDVSFKNLEEHINYLLNRKVMAQNVSIFTKNMIEKEIPQTLIEIISVFTAEGIDANPDLKDYIDDSENGQSIIIEAFKALDYMLYYSSNQFEHNDEIANLLIDMDVIEIICINIKNEYSELTSIAALYLLSDLVQYQQGILRLTKFQDFFVFLFQNFLNIEYSTTSTESDFRERACAAVFLASRIAQQSYRNIVKIFKKDVINILFFALEKVPDCAVNATRGLFYLMFYNPKYISSPSTEGIIQFTIDNDDPEVIFFLLQILKICNLNLEDDRLHSIYSQINFQCFDSFLTINEALSLTTSNFFCTLFKRGSQFIQFALSNFDQLLKVYENASFEIKSSLLNAFDLAFINSNKEQLHLFLENNYDLVILESITSHEKVGLCLDAIIAINNFDEDRIKNHPEVIYDLEVIEAIDAKKKQYKSEEEEANDEENIENVENKEKAHFLLSILSKDESK